MVKKLLAACLAGAAVLALSPGAVADTAATPKPFPVVLSTPTGKVRIREQPKRIVSLSATTTETLFAIGAGRRVVAVDDLSNYPARAPRTKLSGYTPNAEAIAGYRPDLVIVRTDSGLTEALGKLKIPVLVQPEAANLAGAYAQVTQLGRATGFRKGAAATRPLDARADQEGDRLRPPRADAHRLPRADDRLLLGHVSHVHRPDLPDVRAPQHRRQRRRHERLPAAVG